MDLWPSTRAIERMARATTILAVVLGTALSGSLVVSAVATNLDRWSDLPAREPMEVAGFLSTAILARWVAAQGLRSRHPFQAVLARATLAGVANIGASLLIAALPYALTRMDGHAVIAGPGALFVVTMIGAPLGAAFGLALGFAIAVLVTPVRDDLGELDLGVPERVAMRAGAWLALTSAVAFLAGRGAASTMHTLATIVSVVIGLALLAVGMRRMSDRRAFLARVRRGDEPGWVIVPTSSIDASTMPAQRPLPRFASGPIGDRTLVREDVSGEGAYRGNTKRRAYALLPD